MKEKSFTTLIYKTMTNIQKDKQRNISNILLENKDKSTSTKHVEKINQYYKFSYDH